MKFISHCYFILLLALMPMASFAQEITVVDTSAPEDPLIAPTIMMTAVEVQPSCHTYTGCDVLVVDKYRYIKRKYKRRRQ